MTVFDYILYYNRRFTSYTLHHVGTSVTLAISKQLREKKIK